MAQEVGHQLGFSKVLFVPAKIPPQKETATATIHRYNMVKLAIADNPFFALSDIEIAREEVSYTAMTVQLLRQKVADPLCFIIGSDNLPLLPTWHRWRDILENCEIAIAERPLYGRETLHSLKPLVSKSQYQQLCNNFVSIPLVDISSSQLRKRYANKQPNHYFVPVPVDNYILEHNLYQDEI